MKYIFQFSLAIYSQETALKDLILILDEPENHLHPSVIIETIEAALSAAYKKDYGKRGQRIRAEFNEVGGDTKFFLIKDTSQITSLKTMRFREL